MHRVQKLIALALAVAVVASACGGSGNDILVGAAGTTDAQVEVAGAERGCADVLDIADTASGTTVTVDELGRMNEGIARVRSAFRDAPDDADRYFELLEDALNKTADEVADRDQPSGDQIALLLNVELLANGDEFERVSPGYNTFMEATCGDFADAREAAANATDGSGAAAGDDGSASDTDDLDDSAAMGEAEEPAEAATPTPIPLPDPFVNIDASSAGANGSFLLIQFEVGEVWRTNVDPAEALSGATDALGTDEEFVLVEVRLTSDGASASFRPNRFAWLDGSGVTTTAISAFDATGAEVGMGVSAGESLNRYLVFPGTVGTIDGAVLQVLDGDRTPENIPLGAGAASNAYPVALDTGQAGAGTYQSVASNCMYPYETEIRDAVVSLDGVDRQFVLRASEGKRFLTLEMALDVLAVEGPACDWATTVYLNGFDVRLELDNGDVIAPYYFDGRAEVGATATATVTFSFPADVESVEFIDIAGSVLATWTDLELPDA